MIHRLFPPLKHMNIPCAVSLSAALFGFLSFSFAAAGKVALALTLFPIALIIDNFDGMLARKMNRASEFGAALDTFCDAFNFCFIPACIARAIGFSSPLALTLTVLFLLSGITRLTYYSLIGTQDTGKTPYFLGVTTNLSAAIFFVGTSIVLHTSAIAVGIFFTIFFPIASVFMVSSIRLKKYGLVAILFYTLIPATMLYNIVVPMP